MKRKTPNKLRQLDKKADALWSKCVRARDKRCVLCGSDSALQAHHWILTRNQSSKYKFDLRNGVTLCYGCHIHGVHKNPSVYLLNRLKEACILRGIATKEDINEIIANKNEIHKRNLLELDNIIIALEAFLKNCVGTVKSTNGGVSLDASATLGSEK